MKILSHRGYWKQENEKNSVIAMHRSFSMGFGTETDVRDYCGELVISHDIPKEKCLSFEEFLKIFSSYDKNLPLALNIKADGLQKPLLEILNRYSINNYFVFDMSVPDGLGYLKNNINSYTRQSEYEIAPSFYEQAQGVWLDGFNSEWFDDYIINKHLDENKNVCIVSPDLHKRDYKIFWNKLKNYNLKNRDAVMLCTDFPEEARAFFYE